MAIATYLGVGRADWCAVASVIAWCVGAGTSSLVVPGAQRVEAAAAVADAGQQPLPDQQSAIVRARAIMGIPARVEVDAQAELVTLESDDTPYLADRFVGRPIWHVTLSDVKIELASTPEGFAPDPYRRVFDVLLDPDKGQVLKIASRWPEGVPPIAEKWSAESAARGLGASGGEVWHAFPDSGPVTTLFQAIDEMQTNGDGGPQAAPQIVAHYVLMSRINWSTPKPVWSIHLRGTPPLVIHLYPGASPDLRGPNHCRVVVDDATGKELFFTTSPLPDRPDEQAAAPDSVKPPAETKTSEKR